MEKSEHMIGTVVSYLVLSGWLGTVVSHFVSCLVGREP